MTLWDLISQKQREKMAEMLVPSAADRPIWQSCFLVIKSEDEIREALTNRRVDSLLPFADKIRALCEDSLVQVQICLSPSKEVLAICIVAIDGMRTFAVPEEMLHRVASDLGIPDRTPPGDSILRAATPSSPLPPPESLRS